jgi:hypothetical protein
MKIFLGLLIFAGSIHAMDPYRKDAVINGTHISITSNVPFSNVIINNQGIQGTLDIQGSRQKPAPQNFNTILKQAIKKWGFHN